MREYENDRLRASKRAAASLWDQDVGLPYEA